MDDTLIDALEARIKKMSDLRRIMNDMKHTLSEVKITVEDLKNFEQDLNDAIKTTLQIKELDEWSLYTLKLFKEINQANGFKLVPDKRLAEPKTQAFIDIRKAKQGLLERGIQINPEFEHLLQDILNKSVVMTLNFLASKETSIQNAQKLIAPYRKEKIKT
ncbi:MAG: hypothetical protein ACTSRS_10300 [Candidatus Helarchaeota archaeon]